MNNNKTNTQFNLDRNTLLSHSAYFWNLGTKLKKGLTPFKTISKELPGIYLARITKKDEIRAMGPVFVAPYFFIVETPQNQIIKHHWDTGLRDWAKEDWGETFVTQQIPNSLIKAIIIPNRELNEEYCLIYGSGRSLYYFLDGSRLNSNEVLNSCLLGEPLREANDVQNTDTDEMRCRDYEFLRVFSDKIEKRGKPPYIECEKKGIITPSQTLEVLIDIQNNTPGLTPEMQKPIYNANGSLIYSP